jgi:hypothetical protein
VEDQDRKRIGRMRERTRRRMRSTRTRKRRTIFENLAVGSFYQIYDGGRPRQEEEDM